MIIAPLDINCLINQRGLNLFYTHAQDDNAGSNVYRREQI